MLTITFAEIKQMRILLTKYGNDRHFFLSQLGIFGDTNELTNFPR